MNLFMVAEGIRFKGFNTMKLALKLAFVREN